jgi:hypothetical protein
MHKEGFLARALLTGFLLTGPFGRWLLLYQDPSGEGLALSHFGKIHYSANPAALRSMFLTAGYLLYPPWDAISRTHVTSWGWQTTGWPMYARRISSQIVCLLDHESITRWDTNIITLLHQCLPTVLHDVEACRVKKTVLGDRPFTSNISTSLSRPSPDQDSGVLRRTATQSLCISMTIATRSCISPWTQSYSSKASYLGHRIWWEIFKFKHLILGIQAFDEISSLSRLDCQIVPFQRGEETTINS